MNAIKKLKEYATTFLSSLATVVEYFLAIMLAIATVALCVYLIQAFIHIDGLEGWSDFYGDVLETCLFLIIGVELIQMMYDHSPSMIFEVLLFCLARQIVINDDDMISAIIGVAAIALLFLTKKYLFDKEENLEKAEEELTDIEKLKEENPDEFENLNRYAKYIMTEKAEEAEKSGNEAEADQDKEMAERIEAVEHMDMDSSGKTD